MFEESVLMIRAGAFGTDYNTKLIICLVGLALAIYDRVKNKRSDLLIALGLGTLIWSGAEFILQRNDIRELTQPQLFGMTLPGWSHIPFQGASEGGAMAVFGLFFGDRLLRGDTRRKTAIVLAGLMGLILLKGGLVGHFKPGANEISSVREMFALPAIVYISTMMVVALGFLVKVSGAIRRRSLAMVGVLIVICTCFTASQFLEGGRWVTIGEESLRDMPSWPVELGLLTYDVVAEFAAVVFGFYAIPVMLGWIKERKEDWQVDA